MKFPLRLSLLLLCFSVFTARGAVVDSLLPVGGSFNLARIDRAALSELQEIESGYRGIGDHRRMLRQLLSMANDRINLFTRKVRVRVFNDLTRVSAKLRLYPLAMRSFYNASNGDTGLPQDSGYYHELPVAESVPLSPDSVIAAFADGKETEFYAVLLEIKQPFPGKRRAFTHINNVGHTFITLVKYNRDGTIVSRSFGFYPRKAHILSGTPLHPSAPSVFKDDSRHEWDEAAGRLLSCRQFNRMLDVLQSYAHRRYHLNRTNCTDFGLDMARVAGIEVRETAGRWPLGRGNNPGAAGQSLLEGKMSAPGVVRKEELLVLTNTGLTR